MTAHCVRSFSYCCQLTTSFHVPIRSKLSTPHCSQRRPAFGGKTGIILGLIEQLLHDGGVFQHQLRQRAFLFGHCLIQRHVSFDFHSVSSESTTAFLYASMIELS